MILTGIWLVLGVRVLKTLASAIRSYYELAAASLRFKFPNPGPLDGITSTTKNILTMRNCSYQYPGSARPQIMDASLKLCLASRVGVTGVNGAGKTTLIRMVVRETEPDVGEVSSKRMIPTRNIHKVVHTEIFQCAATGSSRVEREATHFVQ